MRYTWRFYVILVFFAVLFLCLIGRVYDLTVRQHEFLSSESKKRSLRVDSTTYHRAMITDRAGTPLAISIPAFSIWLNPKELKDVEDFPWKKVAKLLQTTESQLKNRLKKYHNKQFVYLTRRIPPEKAKAFEGIPAVHQKKEFKRFYPQGAAASHWVGMTNIDDQGIDGAELLFNETLSGVNGANLVIRDREGTVVKELKALTIPEAGEPVSLSMDLRVQYVAYHALKKAVVSAEAASGSVVVIKADTGEILAMANAPSYNPNRPITCKNQCNRNRALSDMFEPGSTIKAFSAMAALESGQYALDSVVDTGNGKLELDGHTISDHGKAFGEISLQDILAKSSNIGIAKLAMSLPETTLYDQFYQLGFGSPTLLGLPGESSGRLVYPNNIKPVNIASLSFGYGMAASTMQLAQAYTVLANDGVRVPLTLLKQDGLPQNAVRVYHKQHVQSLLKALHAAVSVGGTAKRAKVPGYEVAGKTGTAYIAGPKGYDKHDRHYVSSFAGVLPYPNPKLVVVVVLRDPKKGHYGGVIAAPVFAEVASHAMPFYDNQLDCPSCVLEPEV